MARSGTAGKLSKYRSMRDFSRTPEPSGQKAPDRSGHSFVIQKHAARRLHYDFRLEHDGVLWSWSVPKGPSLAPKDRRLAVRTEDHPLDYARFEGVIPAGEYGGGTVVVWDRGRWQPEGDPDDAMKRGRITFSLDGEKLTGRWHLIRTRGGDHKRENWLLFKARDDAANDRLDILEAEPASVVSGRTVEQVAGDPKRQVWTSKPAASKSRAGKASSDGEQVQALVAGLPLGYRLTNLDKVLYPEEGLTKGQLIAYLAVVADWMLPHVANRPLTLVRCPEGRARQCFFQKKILAGSPKPVHPIEIEEASGETAQYMAVRDMPGLVGLAQLGTLEIHTWGAHADRTERPDLMVFDLDPDPAIGWDPVVAGALELRRRLSALGITSYVKTTGGKGLHVVAPLERRHSWDELKAFSHAIAAQMAEDAPALYTTNMGKAHRRGKIFLDYLRNVRGATFIAPYSPRARPGAPVATPLAWDELERGIEPGAFTISSVPRRLAALGEDPWAELPDTAQKITAAAWRAVGGKPEGKS